MQFRPSAVTTVGSNIQLFCNASTFGLGDIEGDRFVLSIHNEGKELKACDNRKNTLECALNFPNVSHADAKMYICVAKPTNACSRKNRTLIVKGKHLFLDFPNMKIHCCNVAI